MCSEVNNDGEQNVVSLSSDVKGSKLSLNRGYAWRALRDHVTEKVGHRARLILEQAFQRGTAKGGDRQSCFQMVRT